MCLRLSNQESCYGYTSHILVFFDITYCHRRCSDWLNWVPCIWRIVFCIRQSLKWQTFKPRTTNFYNTTHLGRKNKHNLRTLFFFLNIVHAIQGPRGTQGRELLNEVVVRAYKEWARWAYYVDNGWPLPWTSQNCTDQGSIVSGVSSRMQQVGRTCLSGASSLPME